MKSRPWIWIIAGQLLMMAAISAMVVIASRAPHAEVPVTHHGR